MTASTAACSWSGSGTSSCPHMLSSRPLLSAAAASAATAASAAEGLIGLIGCWSSACCCCCWRRAPPLCLPLPPCPPFSPPVLLGGPAGAATAAAAPPAGSFGWLALTTCWQQEHREGMPSALPATRQVQPEATKQCNDPGRTLHQAVPPAGHPRHATPQPHHPPTHRPPPSTHRQHSVEHDWLPVLALHGHRVHPILAVLQLQVGSTEQAAGQARQVRQRI